MVCPYIWYIFNIHGLGGLGEIANKGCQEHLHMLMSDLTHMIKKNYCKVHLYVLNRKYTI